MKKSDAKEIKEYCLKIRDAFDQLGDPSTLKKLRNKVLEVAKEEPIDSELSTPLFDVVDYLDEVINASNCYLEAFIYDACEDNLLMYCYEHRLQSEECPYEFEDEDDD